MNAVFLFEMWSALKKYGRWTEVAGHVLGAQREVLSALIVVLRSIREAAAPYAKDDPFAAVVHEVFKFLESGMTILLPRNGAGQATPAVRETQRRALLAIRAVLIEERAAVIPDADRAELRTQIIDSILNVLDVELERVAPEPDTGEVAAFAAPEIPTYS